MRLVHEGVASRIRHRALLDVLGNGAFDFERYKERYLELLGRDRDALFSKTMLSREDFTELFESWIAEDRLRYGTGDYGMRRVSPTKRVRSKANK